MGLLKLFLLLTFKDPIGVDWRTFHVRLCFRPPRDLLTRTHPWQCDGALWFSTNPFVGSVFKRERGGRRMQAGLRVLCAGGGASLCCLLLLGLIYTHLLKEGKYNAEAFPPYLLYQQSDHMKDSHFWKKKGWRSEIFLHRCLRSFIPRRRSRSRGQILYEQQIWIDSLFFSYLSPCSYFRLEFMWHHNFTPCKFNHGWNFHMLTLGHWLLP